MLYHQPEFYAEVAKLYDKYATVGSGEHPDHPKSDWRHEVIDNDTFLGYWDWLALRIEEAEAEAANEAAAQAEREAVVAALPGGPTPEAHRFMKRRLSVVPLKTAWQVRTRNHNGSENVLHELPTDAEALAAAVPLLLENWDVEIEEIDIS